MLSQVPTLVEASSRISPSETPDEMPDAETRRQLATICQWFDDRLDNQPLITILDPGVRRIEIFGKIAWIVDENTRHIDYGALVDDIFRSYKIWFSVLSPIAVTPSSLWLRTIYNDVFSTREGYGGSSRDIAYKRFRWVLPTISDLLVNDQRFIKLSEVLLPAAFALPRDVVDLALCVEQRSADTRYLRSMEFIRVWRRHDAFEIVARDAPSLTGLFSLLCWPAITEFASTDPILSLKRYLMSNGLSEATWRYTVRHSPDLFRGFWNVFREPFQRHGQTIEFLLTLQAAKLPPPPTDAVIRLLGEYHRDNFRGGAFLVAIPPMVTRTAIIEGNRRDQAGQLDAFAQELWDVLWWSSTVSVSPDKNQTRAGWSWLRRQAQAYLRMENQIANATMKHWPARLPAMEIDGYEVFPLDSAEKLIRAGFAMRNCLADRVENCATGKSEYYAVTEWQSNKPEYCVGFDFDEDGDTLSGVKGFANSGAPKEIMELAGRLHVRLREVLSSIGRQP
jgi:hypothetical protein